VPKGQQSMVAAAIRQVFLQPDPEAAHLAFRHVADQLRPRWPKLAAFMDESEHDVLAYMGFPAQHRAKLHSTDEIDKPFLPAGATVLPHGRARGEERGGGCEPRRAA
jgi:putative transposase